VSHPAKLCFNLLLEKYINPLKIISVVGARPNFMKVAPIHKAFLKKDIQLSASGTPQPESAPSIQHPSSNQHPESSTQHPASSIQNPASRIQHPESRIQHPESSI
jgi:hypothetical protein